MTFDLNAYLGRRKRLVEEHLFACLPAAGTRPTPLTEALRHAVLSGGKRLRPILCLAAAEAAGGHADGLMRFSAGLESADDLIDDFTAALDGIAQR